jgi:hypothetical protein
MENIASGSHLGTPGTVLDSMVQIFHMKISYFFPRKKYFKQNPNTIIIIPQMAARIYKIVNDINSEIYIGSTKQILCKRMADHRKSSRREKCKNYLLYQLAETHGWNRFKIILIEEFECKNNEERFRKEQHYIDELKPVLNKCNAYGSSICLHNKPRNTCKECGGSSYCLHNRQRRYCKDCGGSSICLHNRHRRYCKDCGGSSFCLHGKRKSYCKDCNNFICEVCNKKYSSKQYLKNHLNKIHNL